MESRLECNENMQAQRVVGTTLSTYEVMNVMLEVVESLCELSTCWISERIAFEYANSFALGTIHFMYAVRPPYIFNSKRII